MPSRPPLPPTPTLSIFVHRELLLASCTLPRPALRSAELARLTPNQSLRWRSSWRIICIRRTPNGAVSRERGHPVNSADPWARGKLVGARERTSRRRPAPPAVSRLMQRDLHPRHPPWPHGWHVAPGPRQDVVGWERLLLFRRRARNAPDQVDQRRAGDGRDLAGQREAAPGIMLLAHHRAPQTESANCTSSPSHD